MLLFFSRGPTERSSRLAQFAGQGRHKLSSGMSIREVPTSSYGKTVPEGQVTLQAGRRGGDPTRRFEHSDNPSETKGKVYPPPIYVPLYIFCVKPCVPWGPYTALRGVQETEGGAIGGGECYKIRNTVNFTQLPKRVFRRLLV